MLLGEVLESMLTVANVKNHFTVSSQSNSTCGLSQCIRRGLARDMAGLTTAITPPPLLPSLVFFFLLLQLKRSSWLYEKQVFGSEPTFFTLLYLCLTED